MSIVITNAGSTVTLRAPYDPAMPPRARAIGGLWEVTRGLWVFDIRDEVRVCELAREIYGTDGRADRPTVNVRVPVSSGYDAELRVAGRRLAWREGRDDAVCLASGVTLVGGGFANSGGSRANPRLEELEDTVLLIRDVSAEQAQRMVEEVEDAVVEDDALRTALEAERAGLVARLAEIDAALRA